MSIDPAMTTTTAAAGPKGAPFGPARTQDDDGEQEPLRVGEVRRLRLQEGDRLIVHVEGSVGMGPGGAGQLVRQVAEHLELGELPFRVPMVVLSPGMRLEILSG